MTLFIPNDLLDIIQQHAEESYPDEGAGVILGLESDERRSVSLVLPLPNALNEPFAAEIMSAPVFLFFQTPFHDSLGGDPRVVGPWHPQRLEPLHATHPDHDVLQR